VSLDAARGELAALLGDRFSTAASVLGLHARDESRFAPREPDAVAFPASTEEVAGVVRIAARHGLPLIPWGAGSSLEGHVLPVSGGITLDLTGMDRVLEVNAADLDCRVQAGVTRLALERRLGQDGLFFAVDPGADATLGGMAATAASGTRTTRYGTMRENVLGLEAVLADGTVLRTGSRARKSSAGYDLTRLLLGSEGTLAVITELTLRIHGIPEQIAAARCVFEDLAGAVATVTEAVQLGIPMARCELLNPAAIRAVNAHDALSEPEAYTLFLEFHGGPASVAEQVEAVRELAAEHGGGDFHWTATTDERNALWRARHNAYFAVTTGRPGARAQTTDVCVPVSALAGAITATAEDARSLPFPAAMVGHVADGNFHWICPVDVDSDAEQAALREFVDRMVRHALEVGGTCTGEHGVGMGKREYLAGQTGAAAVQAMRAVKRALDPQGILNPGKVLPDPAGSAPPTSAA
jgi:D-lactate dehydrogenase (cytochrome)